MQRLLLYWQSLEGAEALHRFEKKIGINKNKTASRTISKDKIRSTATQHACTLAR